MTFLADHIARNGGCLEPAPFPAPVRGSSRGTGTACSFWKESVAPPPLTGFGDHAVLRWEDAGV